MLRRVAELLCVVALVALAYVTIVGLQVYGEEPQRIADAQPLPACVDLEECPVPSEVAALLWATGEYGKGDYPPCVEVRGAACVLPVMQGRLSGMTPGRGMP